MISQLLMNCCWIGEETVAELYQSIAYSTSEAHKKCQNHEKPIDEAKIAKLAESVKVLNQDAGGRKCKVWPVA